MDPELTSPGYHTQHPFTRALLLFPSYSQLIAEWPGAVLLLCLAVILLCTLAGLLGGHLPDFSKPLLVRGQGEGGGGPRPGHLSSVWGNKSEWPSWGWGGSGRFSPYRDSWEGGIEMICPLNNPGR